MLYISLSVKQFIYIYSIPIGCITSILLSIVWTTLIEQPNDDSIPYYKVAVIGYALSAIVEMLSEPLFVIGQVLLYVRLKVST